MVQRDRFHGKRQYLFIESICNDPDILAQNYRYKMMYSPDYRHTDPEKVQNPVHLACYVKSSVPGLLDLAMLFSCQDIHVKLIICCIA